MSYRTNSQTFTEGSGSGSEMLNYSQGFGTSMTNPVDESTANNIEKNDGRKAFKNINKSSLSKPLLDRALTIIDSINIANIQDATVNLEALHGIVLELWESALDSSQDHQDILALIDNALICIEYPNDEQIAIFREAILDLMNVNLSYAHVEVLQRRFIRNNISPLSLLSEIEEEE